MKLSKNNKDESIEDIYIKCPNCGYLTNYKNIRCGICDILLTEEIKERAKKENVKKLNKIEGFEKESVEKLKKMIKVSDRLRISMIMRVLGFEQKMFEEKLFDWAAEFDFRIDGDFVNINKERVNDFIAMLDRGFDDWTKKEQMKNEKIE